MKITKKLLALLLTVLMLFSSISCITVLAEEAAEATETTTTITESATQFLYDQAYNGAIAEGATAPTKGNTRIPITQTGAWRVAGKRPEGATYADVKGYWFRTENTSTLDMRYGYSTWSHTTPFIGPAYKYGDTSKKVLSVQLRPNSTADGDRKNAFMELYYIAEATGDYNISDGIGGFTVRESAASNYEVYVTVLANGIEIFKSQALSRIHRIARFEDQKVTLNKGDKLEYRFEYITTADTFSGDIIIDFDPYVTLLEEKVETLPELKGAGNVAQMFYDDFVKFGPTTPYTDTVNEETGEVTRVWETDKAYTQNGIKGTQTLAWKAQHYKSSKWSNMGYYYTHRCNTADGELNFAYQSGTSFTQWGRVSVRHKGSNVNNPLTLDISLPLNIYDTRNSFKGLRIAYTAEADAVYFLAPDTFTVNAYPNNANANVYAYISVNGEEVWTSTALANLNDTASFPGYSAPLKTGDILTIGFRWEKKDSAAAYVNGNIRVQFDPDLSVLPDVKTETYSSEDSFNALFEDILSAETVVTSGTLTQPASGWTFKYGTSVSNLTTATKYSLSTGSWGEIRLHANTSADGTWPSIKYRTGTSDRYGLIVHYRNRMSSGSVVSNGYQYNFAYVFTAARQGIHVLDESAFKFSSTYDYKIDGVLKIYKNNELVYTSAEIDANNVSTIIPEMNFQLNVGDQLVFYFERLDSDTTLGYNWHSAYSYVPTITFHRDGVAIKKEGYTPENANRYYAEGLTVPSSVSAYINTTSAIPGYIVKSDAFALSVAPNGNPTVTYKNGEETKQIVFPINVKGGWKKLGVSYDATAKKWNCLINDINMASVEDTEFVSGGAIDKLYIGASDDQYNNQRFRGEIAELKFGDTSWTLADITAETGLTLETLNVESDCSDTFLTFKNQNYRYELYEEFAVPVNTFEAWVRLKTEYADDRSAGRLISSGLNYDPYTTISVIAGGKVQLSVTADQGAGTVTFNTDIRSDEFVHLAITADTVNGIYNCYINGILVDSQQSSVVIPVSPRAYLVSGDYYKNNKSVNFEGDVAGVAMFSDVRTAEEILADMYGGTDLTDAALLGKWSFADTEEGLINQNGNGNDFHPFWETEPDEDVDESFGNYSTFVLIPDTQNFTQSQGASGLAKISNWILNNKDAENIVGVIGLGDIVNIDSKTEQWQEAQQGLLGYPNDKGVTVTEGLPGNVPFLFIQGNHDIGAAATDADGNTVYRNTINLNTYFPFEDLKDNFDGYFEEGKVDNIYILTEDDKGNKYMLLGLEFHPRNEVLDWANEVVAAHPDYNVIVSTHGYQTYDYTTDEQVYISSTSNDYRKIIGENNNPGNQIWEKFVKNHKNIIMVACGHVYHEDIFVTTKQGVNGNTVIEMIANAQTTDVQMRMSGTIVLLRVSEDGTKANVQYYSPVSGQYLKDLNQFNMDWHLIEDEVANIGGESFSDIQDAVDAAEDNDVIEITADIEISGSLTIDKAVTIKLGADKMLKANGGSIKVNADTVITGDGSFTSLDGENPFDIAEGAKLYVEGGSFTGWNPATKGNDFVTDGFGVKAENGTFTVAASNIVADMDNDGNHSITDVAALRMHMMGADLSDFRDVNGDGVYDARDIVRSKRVLAGLYNTIATSEELVAAMKNGGNHILVKDLTVSDTSVIVPAGVEATLDLNGNTINGTFNVPEKETYTSADNRILFDVKGTLTINGEGAIDLTVTGGDMGWSAMSVAVLANGGDVTINDATVHNESVTAMAYALDTNPWGPNGDTVEVVLNNVDLASSYLTVRVRDGGPSLVRLTATDSHFGYLYEGYNYLGYIWYQENDNNYGTAVEVVLDNCEVDTRYISTEYLSVLRYADNAEEAQAAIDNAVAGDTIVLKEGVDYGTLVFGQNADSRVVDISELGGDAAGNEHYSKYENITILGNGAIVDQIDFKVGWIDGTEGASYVDIKNLTVKGVNFSGEKTAFNMEGGKGGFLGIDGLTITDCSMNDADGDDRFVFQQITGYKELNDKTANEYVMTTGVKNLTITECEVTGAYMVIESRAMENLTITNNTFTGIKARDMLITSDTTHYPTIGYTGTITVTGNTSSYGEERFVRASVNGDVEMIVTDNTINSYLGADGDYIKISGATGTVTVEDNSITYGSAVSAQAALDVAKDGDTIYLSEAINYGDLVIRINEQSELVDDYYYYMDNYDSSYYGKADWQYAKRVINDLTITGVEGAIINSLTVTAACTTDKNVLGTRNNMFEINNLTISNITTADGFHFNVSDVTVAVSETETILAPHIKLDGLTIHNCKTTVGGSTDKTIGRKLLGIANTGSVSNAKNIVVTDCIVTDMYQGVYIVDGENVRVEGNSFSGLAHNSIHVNEFCSGNIAIIGNNIDNVADRPIRLYGVASGTVTIENNTITNSEGDNGQFFKSGNMGAELIWNNNTADGVEIVLSTSGTDIIGTKSAE